MPNFVDIRLFIRAVRTDKCRQEVLIVLCLRFEPIIYRNNCKFFICIHFYRGGSPGSGGFQADNQAGKKLDGSFIRTLLRGL